MCEVRIDLIKSEITSMTTLQNMNQTWQYIFADMHINQVKKKTDVLECTS